MASGWTEIAERLLAPSEPRTPVVHKQPTCSMSPPAAFLPSSSSVGESPVAVLSDQARLYVDMRRARGEHSPLLVPLEAQLVRGFARELHAGTAISARLELLSSWLLVSALDQHSIQKLVSQLGSLARLVTLSDAALRSLAERFNVEASASRRLRAATQRLAAHFQAWKESGSEPLVSDEQLAWSSAAISSGATSPATASPRGFSTVNAANAAAAKALTCTSLDQPSPTSSSSSGGGLRKALHLGGGGGPRALERGGGRVAALHLPSSSSSVDADLPRSASHDAQLSAASSQPSIPPGPASARLDPTSYQFPVLSAKTNAARLARDAFGVRAQTLSPTISPSSVRSADGTGPGPPTFLGPMKTLPNSMSAQFGTLPKSPKSNRILHQIPHVWVSRRSTFRLNDKSCIVCQRPLGFLAQCEKCKSCKLRVHSACKARVNDSCGLTSKHLRIFLEDAFIKTHGNQAWGDTPLPASRSMNSMNEPTAFQYPDNSVVDSSSSTNSSAPSTPALIAQTASASSPYVLPGAPRGTRFPFPDTLPEVVLNEPSEDAEGRARASTEASGSSTTQSEGQTPEVGDNSELTATVTSSTSTANSVGSGTLIDSEHTLLIDSQGSATENSAEVSPGGSQTAGPSHKWDRNAWNMFTIRAPSGNSGWNEVTIQMNTIRFDEVNSLIGKGRFGEVVRGDHFGEVAVKFLNMDHVTGEEQQMEEFKEEVKAFKNARHDNLIFFLGYVFEHKRLGIVMNLCKGKPLNQVIHERSGEPMDFSQSVEIATQICQGVSYLHTKKFLHKDLRSKNIFIEGKKKVVITDFGLFSTKRLGIPELPMGFLIPKYWLCYLAPELLRALAEDLRELPFSELTDVFAFGTVWYELLTGEYPFERVDPHQIIWRAGSGLHGALHNVNSLREVKLKELLMRCWSFSDSERPTFADILASLERLPKKRLVRSPSFPVARSHESMF